MFHFRVGEIETKSAAFDFRMDAPSRQSSPQSPHSSPAFRDFVAVLELLESALIGADRQRGHSASNNPTDQRRHGNGQQPRNQLHQILATWLAVCRQFRASIAEWLPLLVPQVRAKIQSDRRASLISRADFRRTPGAATICASTGWAST